MDDLLDSFSKKAKQYINRIGTRKVFPEPEALENLEHFDIPLQEESIPASEALDELEQFGSPATVASTGNRYFGFVIGGASPAPMAANLMAGVWDQNGGLEASSPVSNFIEKICRKWLVDILNLSPETEAGFVTGATMANFTGIAAARHALLEKAGWDVEDNGLFNAPEIHVIVGEEVHVSVLKALSMLGMGRNRITRIPVDSQGRMKIDKIPQYSGPTLICAQAGNVNTGAFDPIDEICEIARKTGAWVHVDAAFGLWAAASPNYAHLCKGIQNADSIGTDAHKWLNVPYDSGIVFVKEKKHLISSMSATASYLGSNDRQEPFHYVPEMSRRSRGLEIWAALRSMGKAGLSELIESNCKSAVLFADKLTEAGYQVLNDVVLNQVMVSFGEKEVTERIIKKVQEDGTCWCGGTEWQGHTAMRISVSSFKTTREDVIKSAEAIIRIALKTRNAII